MSVPVVSDRDRKRAALEEIAAMRSDFAATVARQAEWLLDHWREEDGRELTPGEAFDRATAPYPFDLLEREPEQISWHELSNAMERDPEKGAAAWQQVKAAARMELQTGLRALRAHERTFASPYERAQVAVILESLVESLKPKGGAEHLLVQQIAAAYEMWLRWEKVLTQRVDEEVWHVERDRRRTWENLSPREQERWEQNHGWMPPRLSDAQAIEQAAMLADRAQRAYVRLLRAFRDMRRMLGPVIVAGGQVNIAEQQVNVAGARSEKR